MIFLFVDNISYAKISENIYDSCAKVKQDCTIPYIST